MAEYLSGFSDFCIGVNYRALNAGTRMWSKFPADELDTAFAAQKNSAFDPENGLCFVYRKLVGIAGLELPEKSKEIGITRHKKVLYQLFG